jgi:hypothetical protein
MSAIELFSGTESFSKVMREKGFDCFTVDNDEQFNPSLVKDIFDLELSELPPCPFIVWASPPCQAFSVTQIRNNWDFDDNPTTTKAEKSIILLEKTISLISFLSPVYFVIENPRGKMRKIIEPVLRKYNLDFKRETVTYCQYGDKRMKPTDLWTNIFSWTPKPMCKNGDSCHERAPRGIFNSGTMGLKNSVNRSIIPRSLCVEIRGAILGLDLH